MRYKVINVRRNVRIVRYKEKNVICNLAIQFFCAILAAFYLTILTFFSLREKKVRIVRYKLTICEKK